MTTEVLAHCPGCGKCARPGVCPTQAILIEGGKAVIGRGCIDCGLCIPVCPIRLIVQSAAPVIQTVTDAAPTVTNREEVNHGETSTGS